MAPLSISLRDRLREETKSAHKQLDAVAGALDAFSSAANYRIYLSCLHQLYVTFGEHIDWASGQAGIALTVEHLKSAIVDDIGGDLYMTAKPTATAEDDEASKWAAAYVMEGSAMGARFMIKQIAEGSSSKESLKCQYLEQLAADSFKRWPVFIAVLDKADCDPDRAVQAAVQVFETAKEIFAASIPNSD